MASPEKPWKLISASVAGSSHLARSAGCEDSHAYKVLSDDVVIAAAADGAGSANQSALASRIAVEAAVNFLSDRLCESSDSDEPELTALMMECLEIARSAIEAKASEPQSGEQEVSLADLATTLLVLCITRQWAAALQIGDGAIVLRRETGGVSTFLPPLRGEYLNETQFLSSPDFKDRARTRVVPSSDIDGFAILTDGMELLSIDYSTGDPHGPFFESMFAFSAEADASDEALAGFLESDRVCERTDDDKTLLLATRQ